ncbi:MAG: UbiD family decarboxylase [Flavobacteriales bacterium]
MRFKSLSACIDALEAGGMLRRIEREVDPHLEMAAIHRRVYGAGGPALYFSHVRGSSFPAVSNLFGTKERVEFLFGDSMELLQRALRYRTDPTGILTHPQGALSLFRSLPLKTTGTGLMASGAGISSLPQIKSWPGDGGAFILLPQVYSESLSAPGWKRSNLGCYRIQMSGNNYRENMELGLHFQLHRGIGNHYAEAAGRGEPLRVSIFVGGPPAHIFASVFPLPEGMPEIALAGLLNRRRFRYCIKDGFVISNDADFVITGFVRPGVLKPEGPFGDHLGYYSLRHDYPVIEVQKVYHRKHAVWPFTVVGRSPQEDKHIADFIHEITGSAIPVEIPGLQQVRAVDAAGVHPLLLAVGSERYEPFAKEKKPRELLTIANHILGTGQLSLAKYLIIAAAEDDSRIHVRDITAFFRHVLERVDWSRDLHFQTRTTMDTLDYSHAELNSGSKVIIACSGKKRRELKSDVPGHLQLPDGCTDIKVIMPGVLIISGTAFTTYEAAALLMQRLGDAVKNEDGFPLMLLADDSGFAASSLENFLWVAFTRSNPSHDIYGSMSFTENKHWGCRGPLLIDARIKPHHAPVLQVDEDIEKRVDALGARGMPLHGII